MVSAWDASRTLYVLSGGEGVNRPLAVAKGDVFDPVWQAGGSELVYLQRGVLWLWRSGKAPQRLAPLDATAQRRNGGTSDVTSYHGYTTYRSRFAFYAPAPSARGAS